MPAGRINAGRLIELVGGKALVIPPEGWNSRNFARHGGPMLRTMAYVAKLTQRQAAPGMARDLFRIMRKQLNAVTDRVLMAQRFRAAPAAGAKADFIDINALSHESLWAQAMDEVFRSAALEVEVTVLPTIQSVMAQGYSKVGMLLGQNADPDVNPAIAREARELAKQVTLVNETTRRQMDVVVRNSIGGNLTVAETATKLHETLPHVYGNRSLTIARTELNKAWTQGAVQSFQSSSSVTHVSVIGCESREEDRWQQPSYQQFMYRGESTCNIEDVPVADAGKLVFHPNHTGNMVPSRFRNPDGTVDLEND